MKAITSKLAVCLILATLMILLIQIAGMLIVIVPLLSPIFVAVCAQSHNHIKNVITKMSRLAKFHFSVQGGAW
jgi:type IV secretory pathway VirB3-like protein